jgi:bifunctional DNase/RNase
VAVDAGAVQVEIERIEENGWHSATSPNGLPLVVLKEVGGERSMSFGVTMEQGAMLGLARQGYHPARPLTHDFLCGIVSGLGASVEGVTVSGVEDKSILAHVALRSASGSIVRVDCRPSDGLIFAARAGAPIFVVDDLLRDAA